MTIQLNRSHLLHYYKLNSCIPSRLAYVYENCDTLWLEKVMLFYCLSDALKRAADFYKNNHIELRETNVIKMPQYRCIMPKPGILLMTRRMMSTIEFIWILYCDQSAHSVRSRTFCYFCLFVCDFAQYSISKYTQYRCWAEEWSKT